MAELGELAGHLAHEIRNPLSTIKMNLQLLAEDITESKERIKTCCGNNPGEIDDLLHHYNRQQRKIETITQEADRLSDTLKDFLHYAGRMEMHPARQDIHEILDDLIDFYEPQAISKGVQIRRGLGHSPIICRVDAGLIKQAILNLFINAIQAMEAGGELLIRTRIQSDEVLIDIIDTGPGIPPEEQEKIFEPYYTTRSEGSGLGLPTCRRIIEEHKGRIELHSEVGKGSCFTVILPLAQEEAESPG